MAKVQVGDLVCMFRRKNKGMGIVLEHVDDLIEKADAGVTFDEFMEAIDAIGDKYDARAAYRRKLKEHAKHPDLITTCLIYNASWAKKPKKEFVRVRWFDNPSMYETSRTKEIEEWCPIDWLKKVQANSYYVDEINIYPRYKVGDFVRCVHVYYNYHYYYGYHDEDGEPLDDHHGIIVDVDFACWDGFEEDFEVIYVVHCTDGIRRFFSEDEVFKMS